MNEPIDVAAFVAQLADDNRLARELDDLVAHDVRARADDAVLAELEPATEAPLLEQLVARALCVFLEAQLRGLHAVRDAAEYEAALYKTFGEVDLPEPARYDEAIEAYRRLIQEDEQCSRARWATAQRPGPAGGPVVPHRSAAAV